METTTLSIKGQVIIPKSIRVAHGWGPGTKFTVEEVEGGVLLRNTALFPPSRLEEAGALRYHGRPKTLAIMNAGIAREVKPRRDRGRY